MAAGEAFAGAAEAGASLDNAQAAAERAAEIALQGLSDLYDDTYTRVLPRFAQRTYDALQDERGATPQHRKGPDGDIWLAAVRRFLSREAGALITAVSSTVLGRVRDVLAREVTAGKGIGEIARAFRRAIPTLSRERATVWARTETLRASNLGAMAGARASGLRLEKEWLATPDGRTRDTHAEAHGQRVPLEEPFSVGGYHAMQPGDASLPVSETANCRCNVAFIPID